MLPPMTTKPPAMMPAAHQSAGRPRHQERAEQQTDHKGRERHPCQGRSHIPDILKERSQLVEECALSHK